MSEQVGTITWISGPVVRARGSRHVGMLELVEVGDERLVGEVIGLKGDQMTVQVYEETSGMQTGAPIYGTGLPLSVELGPGLIQSIYDGVQRPLPLIEEAVGSFITRGARFDSINREKKWKFTPKVKVGDEVKGGAVLGVVMETDTFEHRIMLNPDDSGSISWIAPVGEYTVDEPIAKIKTGKEEKTATMLQRWPVRRARPFVSRRGANIPLITGQRILDTFFPVAKGGAAGIPGPFGSGKTVTQHSIAKWADAEVIVYIGCGERGNEMTEVLQEFPHLIDPRTGNPLMERTVLIANTSNMPVAAREASIYTGITIAEYYRDMGYHVALMADSTSRWAEALREVSGRLEEMPAEEGYPAYLAGRLAEFYERAGYVDTLNGAQGSVSIVGAVSPPGGDFSEPVTQHTKRFIRCFWALDKSLASARHFPAINWLDSYSEYLEDVGAWWREKTGKDWLAMRNRAMELLSDEARLSQIVKLVGPDALPYTERMVLETTRLIREGILQQNATEAVDAYSSVEKQIRLLELVLYFHERGMAIVKRGAPINLIHDLPVVDTIIRAKSSVTNEEMHKFDDIQKQIDQQMGQLDAEYRS
ncbi:MAG: V-type ATP synthase subunit A [Chloroflexi bacterium]|nr:V-type ATP synthase subunit A [Chloroflexi bacterium CFX1]MCK6567456.1 V-type ATP synthase subunit A [Anaerolineales bacterium]MCQ3952459.1 V-type ATP synthase subunit A [Chloroflexota bacterium]MDL1919150.1 V-type ATP synthase subunit A [Chloroflexi bacterium CFX5]NUQ58393.1 V-type ATP synthase subunit A [Anaerolineales bacterium]